MRFTEEEGEEKSDLKSSLKQALIKGFSNYSVKFLEVVNDRVVRSWLFFERLKKLQKTDFSAPILGFETGTKDEMK